MDKKINKEKQQLTMAEAIKLVYERRRIFDSKTENLRPKVKALLNAFNDFHSDFQITDFSVDGLDVMEEYPEYTVYKWDDTTSIMEIRDDDKLAYLVVDGEDATAVGTLCEIPLNPLQS